MDDLRSPLAVYPSDKVAGTGKGKLIALAIAAAVAVAAPLAQKWEGYSGKAYRDPAGYLTQCYGETRDIDPSRIYSKSECATKMRARMAADYAPIILACVPGFIAAAHDPKVAKVYGAFLDASYNAGPYAVCKGFAPLLNAGSTRAACDKLPAWYITAKGVRYQGLVNRRCDERGVCLAGLS